MKKIWLVPALFVFGISLVLAQASFFPDVRDTDWFAQYVNAIKDWGIINGQGDGTFAPEQNINRAEFSKMLYLYDERVDEKISEFFSAADTAEPSLPSTLALRRYDALPGECPTDWQEIDLGRIWRTNSTGYVNVRTCLSEKNCKTVDFDRYNSEEISSCPAGWEEADYGIINRESGGKRVFRRTCYICQ